MLLPPGQEHHGVDEERCASLLHGHVAVSNQATVDIGKFEPAAAASPSVVAVSPL
jgi:hypothetical protein